jgi:hypothetical protein
MARKQETRRSRGALAWPGVGNWQNLAFHCCHLRAMRHGALLPPGGASTVKEFMEAFVEDIEAHSKEEKPN